MTAQRVRRPRGLVRRRQPGDVRRGGAAPGRRASRARSRRALGRAPAVPVRVVWQPVLDRRRTRSAGLCLEANATTSCVGRDRSGCTPSRRPRCGSPGSPRCASRCCTCTRSSTSPLPWAEIDMDFMNLNQSAHGDREFGFIETRHAAARARPSSATGATRRVVAPDRRLGARRLRLGASRAACKLARFGDNMRHVAVTEGDKVEAQMRLRLLGQRLRRRRPRRRDRRRRRRRRRRAGRRLRGRATTSRPSCAAAASGTSRCATPPRIEARACARSSTAAASARSPTPSRTCTALRAAARPRRAAADGRRLRLRRRGRLEDRRAACAILKVMARGPARRHVVHGGLHLRPRAGQRADPRRAHARDLPVARRRQAVAARSIRSRSAAGRIRCGSCSTPPPGPASSSRCSTSATASGWSSTRSRSSRPPQPLPKLPVGARGLAARAGLRDRRRGLADGGRAAPHRVSTARRRRGDRRLRRIAGIELLVIDERRRVRGLRERAALERRLLPPGPRNLKWALSVETTARSQFSPGPPPNRADVDAGPSGIDVRSLFACVCCS